MNDKTNTRGDRARQSDSCSSNQFQIIARGRLAEARKWFAHRGWSTLPQNDRGRSILQWVADHAALAYPANPEAAVRRICKPLVPWLSDSRLEELVESIKTSNKRWTHDQSAMVLGIAVRDCLTQGFQFLGAADDPDYLTRQEARRAKKAASARKRRAAKSTGRPCGRPPLELSPEEKRAHTNAQAAQRMREFRLRKNASPHNIEKTGKATQFSVTDPILVPLAPLDDSAQRLKRDGALLRLDDVLEGEIIGPGRSALAARPPIDHLSRAIARAYVLEQMGGTLR